MKRKYQIPVSEVLYGTSRYTFMDPSNAELPPGQEMVNTNSFDEEGEINTDTNHSLWDK